MADPLRFDGQVVAVVGDAPEIAERFRAVGAEVADSLDGVERVDAVVCVPGPPPEGSDGPIVIGRNLVEPLGVAQQAYGLMGDGGAIVFVVRARGLRPLPGGAAYEAAEAGLVNVVTTLALEWGPAVRANCVSVGEGESAADTCLFLASPLARGINGANVVVDGGGERPAFLAAAAG